MMMMMMMMMTMMTMMTMMIDDDYGDDDVSNDKGNNDDLSLENSHFKALTTKDAYRLVRILHAQMRTWGYLGDKG